MKTRTELNKEIRNLKKLSDDYMLSVTSLLTRVNVLEEKLYVSESKRKGKKHISTLFVGNKTIRRKV